MRLWSTTPASLLPTSLHQPLDLGIVRVGIHDYHAFACVTVFHGDRHGITVVANFLAGKVGYQNCPSCHCPLLWDQWFLLTKQTIILPETRQADRRTGERGGGAVHAGSRVIGWSPAARGRPERVRVLVGRGESASGETATAWLPPQ